MAALSAFFCRWRGAAARPQPLNAPVAQPAQHVDMHGRIFVSNLFWQPLPNPRTAIQDARAFGIQNGWTWGVIRSGARAQAGFAECGHEVRTLKGTLSLAAQLAAQLGDAWLGAFKVAEGRYAVIAVHERWIIPGFDVVCDAGQAALLWRWPDSRWWVTGSHRCAPGQRRSQGCALNVRSAHRRTRSTERLQRKGCPTALIRGCGRPARRRLHAPVQRRLARCRSIWPAGVSTMRAAKKASSPCN